VITPRSKSFLFDIEGRYKMSNRETVIKEIEQISEHFLEEMLDFVHFLKTKITRERLNTAIASESVLKRIG
jgi:hypothetical protein